jgi:hypothetical protein
LSKIWADLQGFWKNDIWQIQGVLALAMELFGLFCATRDQNDLMTRLTA